MRIKRKLPPVVPVTILTGFLGSGKTTLLNHILKDTRHGMKFAIIENELGAISVDEKVLSENVNDEVVEVTNGCICCAIRGDLVKALHSLYQKVETFDGVIIETTGMADPAPVCQTFFIDEEIRSMYRLDCVVTVVDAKHILQRVYEKKPEGCENEAIEQVAFADKILLNKTDLSNEDELNEIERELKELNPTACVQRTHYSQVNPKDILNIKAFELRRVLDFDPKFLEKEEKPRHDRSIKSIAAKVEGEVNVAMLQSWIQRLISEDGANLYRYKGIIAVKGKEEKFVFQGVGMLFHGGFSQQKWQSGQKRESCFVFIGKNLERAFYKGGFMACRVDAPLRFPIGTAVLANVGGWKPGRIAKQWDGGHAYRIELLDDALTTVWAPIDVDAYVRTVAVK